MIAPRLSVRWTIGDVSKFGFESLALSICGARRIFGSQARYTVTYNTITLTELRERLGEIGDGIEWCDATGLLPDFIDQALDAGRAEGAGWKLAPPLLDTLPCLSLDNDCILWAIPDAIARWLEHAHDSCCAVVAEDVRACYGQFTPLIPGDFACNLGIRATSAGFPLTSALRRVLEDNQVVLHSELDEQGLQLAAIMRHCVPDRVRLDEVTICSPFPPHLPYLGTAGAHFCGLNANVLPWEFYGRPALDCVREHWLRHRDTIAARVGTLPATL